MKEEKQVAERLVDFLEEHKGEVFSASELTKHLNAIFDIVIKKLHQLVKYHEVGYERVSWRLARRIYKNPNLKRGMKLYFLE